MRSPRLVGPPQIHVPSSERRGPGSLVTVKTLSPSERALVASLIEARSCERFGLLRDHLEDRELADFFGSLFESEARHHSTYVRLARTFAPADEVQERLKELAEEEARFIAEGDDVPRMHS